VTNLIEATDLVFKDWLAYMAANSLEEVTLFGNEDGVGGVRPDAGTDPWYRVSYREASGGRANLNGVVGTRSYERVGFLSIQCFDLVNKGVRDVITMAENARTYFEDRRNTTDTNIIYLNADIRPQQPDGKWFPVLLEIRVEVSDTK